jgi:hypothetical protein
LTDFEQRFQRLTGGKWLVAENRGKRRGQRLERLIRVESRSSRSSCISEIELQERISGHDLSMALIYERGLRAKDSLIRLTPF